MKPKLKLKNGVRASAKLRSARALLASDRAQSMAEVALLAPLLLIIVLGVVEMGRYASLSILVANAARAGAQYGAQNLADAADTAGITCAAENESLDAATPPVCPSNNPFILPVPPSVTPTLTVSFPAGTPTVCGCDNGGTISALSTCTSPCSGHMVISVQVTATGAFSPLFDYTQPLFGTLTIPSLTVTSTATERVAQ